MDYFYTPYNQDFLLRKHMTFENGDENTKDEEVVRQATPPPMRSSCFKNDAPIVTADSTIVLNYEIEPEESKTVPLRDQVMTKADVAKLEKKTWIEVKDVIFETDKNILDYLNFHCKRWRKTEALTLHEVDGPGGNESTANRSLRHRGGRNTHLASQMTPATVSASTIGHNTPICNPKRKVTAEIHQNKREPTINLTMIE